MPAILKSEAVEKLAQTVESASADDLVDIYTELFPDRPRLDASDAVGRLAEITSYIRAKMEPEEIVDLWNVVFPADRNVYYDEVDGLVYYNQEEPWYAGK